MRIGHLRDVGSNLARRANAREPLTLEDTVDDLGAGADLDPLRRAGREQSAGQRPRVDRRLAGREDAAVERGRQPRLQLAAAARRQPLRLQLERALQVVDAAQLRRLVAVEGDVQGAEALVAGTLPRRRLQLGDELRVQARRRQGQLQQLRLAEAELADRRQHPGRYLGRAAAGHSRSSTATRAPRWASRQAQLSPITPAPTTTTSKSRSSLKPFASAGITRIRSRRSVASMPPSQPSRAPVLPRCYPSAAPGQGLRP